MQQSGSCIMACGWFAWSYKLGITETEKACDIKGKIFNPNTDLVRSWKLKIGRWGCQSNVPGIPSLLTLREKNHNKQSSQNASNQRKEKQPEAWIILALHWGTSHWITENWLLLNVEFPLCAWALEPLGEELIYTD